MFYANFVTEAVQYGIESEAVALYIEEMQQEGILVEVEEVRLLLSQKKTSDGTVRLKRTHDYYLQVQGQLYLASNLGLKGSVLIVYFGEMPVFKEKFTFETNWWKNEVLPKLE